MNLFGSPGCKVERAPSWRRCARCEGTALAAKGMAFYALVQPPGVLHLVPAEPPRDKRLLRLSQRFNLRNET